MAIAYNLTRLVFLEVAQILRTQPWRHLEALHEAYKGRSIPKPGAFDAGVPAGVEPS